MPKRKVYQVIQVYDYKGRPNTEIVRFESTRMKDVNKWLREQAEPQTPSRYYRIGEVKKEIEK